jgi:NAD(P)-dependent dehydrogenase (short-subunit alcohol dehydrogenase family)
MTEVVVVTGIGGMGIACARRLGAGRALVIADFDGDKLARETETLAADGFAVTPIQVDVSDRTSVAGLASGAGALGTLRTVVHTAGLSPTQASTERILDVDLLGTDHVLDAFAGLVTDGTVAVCIASMAGYLGGLEPALEVALATIDTDELLSAIGPLDGVDSGQAYCIAKRANHLRVERAAAVWGKRGGRVVSISPGIISTPMGRLELEEGHREQMQAQLDMSAVPRIGTAEDIAAAVEWLASPAASFVTGCDLRVDGGVTAAIHGLGVGFGPAAS